MFIHFATAYIDFPTSLHTYVTLSETHKAGPKIHDNYHTYVCNLDNHQICESYHIKYIGIAKDENDFRHFIRPSVLLTYNTTTLTQKYKIPVLGLESQYINYGVQSTEPFSVFLYNNHKDPEFIDYAFLIFIGVAIIYALLSIVVKRCAMVYENHKTMQKIMTCTKFKSDALLNTNCTICLDDFVDNEPVVTLTECKHVFHKQCINTWLDTKKTCPNCQNAII